MAPNLLVATQTLFTPHRWFTRKHSEPKRSLRKTEHWDDPKPGTYEYIPGRGWYLTRPDNEDGTPGERLEKPKLVTYSRVLRRYLFHTEYERRKLAGEIKDQNGKTREVGFFQLDDGVAWVNCWDHKGEFMPGPYERWCIDDRTEKFRKMLKGDDPNWRSRRGRKSAESNKSSDNSGDERENGTYNIPREGHSRPASTFNYVMSPVNSRPPSPHRGVPHSEGHTRASSLSGTTFAARSESQSRTQQAAQSCSRPASIRNSSAEDVASTPKKTSSSAPNGTRGLAAAVAQKLGAQESLTEHREHE